LGSGSRPGPIIGKVDKNDTGNLGNLPEFDIPPQRRLPPRVVGQGPPSGAGAPPLPGAVAAFVEGPPSRPPIKLDHGFLDDGHGNIDPKKFEAPTPKDRSDKQIWRAGLEFKKQTHPEWHDATRAYEHFLVDNNGETLIIRYDGFIKEDNNGKIVLSSAVDDMRTGVLDIFDRKFPRPTATLRRDELAVTSTAVEVGSDILELRYPYPSTENWQKAIGGHFLWISANAVIDSDPAANIRKVFIAFVLHAEDMYNFEPGKSDIGTGIPDELNGRFEVTRLATEFLQTGLGLGTISFTITNTKQANNRVVPADQKVLFP
jgi:hypothetical protein